MRFKLSCLAVLAAAGFANADTAEEASGADISGSWRFETAPYHAGTCQLTGVMRLASRADGYVCELTAVETCEGLGRSVVEQACDARRTGDQLAIVSTIRETLESKGEGFRYYPDNFALNIDSSDQMHGALVSAVSAPAVFRRTSDGVS